MGMMTEEQAMGLVMAQASVRPMTADEMVTMKNEILAKFNGEVCVPAENEVAKLIADPKTAIKERTITCCICGEKMTVLTSKHLFKHGVTPDEYRDMCGYKKGQPLASKLLSRTRKEKMQSMKLWERRKKNTSENTGKPEKAKPKKDATPATV